MKAAGDGGMGEDEVVEVGVLLEFWKISSSKCEWPGGDVATKDWAVESKQKETGQRHHWEQDSKKGGKKREMFFILDANLKKILQTVPT